MAIAKNIAKRTKRRHVPWRPKPNVAKRARARAIMKRKRIKPLTKAEARALCDKAIDGPVGFAKLEPGKVLSVNAVDDAE